MKQAKVLVIDDNTAVLSTLRIVLKSCFSTVVAVADPKLIPALISQGDVDAVLLDMNFGSDRLDGQDGLFWLDRIINRSGLDNPPAVVTAFGDISLAVQSLKKGASDFIQKPWDNNDLVTKLSEAIDKRDARAREAQDATADAASDETEVTSTLEEMEKQAIRKMLEQSDRNLSVAADKLGVSRQTLYNKMKRYGID